MFESILSAYSRTQIIILQQIYRKRKITRAELTEATGFQLLTVTKSVSRLLADGLIAEREYRQSTGGRKAALLSVNPDYRYTLTADIGASCARIGVVGMDGSVIESEIIAAEVHDNGNTVPARHVTVAQLRAKLTKLIRKYGREKILGLGVGVSGVVRHSSGQILFCPNIEGWNNVDMQKEFAEPLGIPVFVDTAARCMALAEYTLGAGQGVADQVCISIGTSVAAGILLDGKVYRGADEAAGEIGHTTVRADGRRCTCGNRDCLELYVTTPTLLMQAKRALPAFSGFSPLKTIVQGRAYPTPQELQAAAMQGDKLALEILQRCAETIGTAVGYLTNILNPNLIVLGGATIDFFPQLVEEVARISQRSGFTVTQQNLAIKPYALGTLSAMIGAALQVIDAFF
ncbi:MAG: ROK family transcriptional regulator [Oscillospiraceae bacterium]|nr:ROK family transcriptional regulator [Oscillospiraceae bacterium]